MRINSAKAKEIKFNYLSPPKIIEKDKKIDIQCHPIGKRSNEIEAFEIA